MAKIRDRHTAGRIRSLYLDLLAKVLVNSIYEDPASDLSGFRAYDEETRKTGRDWPKNAHTMVGLARLDNLHHLVQRTLDDRIPGNYVEAGVWRGGCCIMIKAVLKANGDENRKVFVADSFAGFPPPRPEVFEADLGDIHHTFPELRVSLEEVRRNFSKYGLLDENVIFVPGYFDETLPTMREEQFALVRLDCDMYASTIVALENLYNRVSSGGFVIIDDYGAIPACKQATDDYRHKHGINEPVTPVDWTGIWWRKS